MVSQFFLSILLPPMTSPQDSITTERGGSRRRSAGSRRLTRLVFNRATQIYTDMSLTTRSTITIRPAKSRTTKCP
jgi:hypothetical protein